MSRIIAIDYGKKRTGIAVRVCGRAFHLGSGAPYHAGSRTEKERQAEQGVGGRNQRDYYPANLFGEQTFLFFISV